MLKIYGVPNSQPVRAVVWTCLMKGLPFEFEIRLMGGDLREEGITQNQRISNFEMSDQALSDVLTGLVVTKLDGTAKAGMLFALASQSLGAQRIPVRFIGVGEGIEDLRAFEAEAFVSALLQADES